MVSTGLSSGAQNHPSFHLPDASWCPNTSKSVCPLSLRDAVALGLLVSSPRRTSCGVESVQAGLRSRATMQRSDRSPRLPVRFQSFPLPLRPPLEGGTAELMESEGRDDRTRRSELLMKNR